MPVRENRHSHFNTNTTETVLLGQSGELQDGVVRINYKSDFPLEVKVVRNGVAENFPDADFTLTAKTEGGFTVYKSRTQSRRV